ncbi:MAG TPA: 3'-5' exonuclease [Anaeromyxobacteraceae bacterium]
MLWPSPAWDEVVYWALDLETGGLDPRRDPIVAVGMVPLRGGTIRLGESYRSLVRTNGSGAISAASVRAHQLVPGEVRDAPPLAEVLREVDRRLADGVLLVHQAAIDVRFLRRAHQEVRLRWPAPRVVDTVDLLLKAARKERFIDPSAQEREPDLNLWAARARYGLPAYAAHDALTDALATAELFLVLRQALGARTLRDLR